MILKDNNLFWKLSFVKWKQSDAEETLPQGVINLIPNHYLDVGYGKGFRI